MAVLKYKSSDGTWKAIATKEGNGVTNETDPVFSASPAASITEAKKTEWDGKQDAIADLDAIRSGAEKGATALQSYTEQYKGTITGVSANGTSVATSGVANIPAASTSKYGVTKLSSATNSTSTSLAATASAVKAAYDLANGKQAKLVSGTNIKTINGTSILGSGNITIEGGGGSSGGGGGIEWADLSDHGFVEQDYWCAHFTQNRGYMQPNKVYVMTRMPVDSLLVEDFIQSNDYVDEYRMIFRSSQYGFGIAVSNSQTHFNVLQDSDLSAEGFKPNTWYDLRLIRTLYNGEQYVLVKAIKFNETT